MAGERIGRKKICQSHPHNPNQGQFIRPGGSAVGKTMEQHALKM